ncbi:MAG: Kef-type K+ transport system, predicted NAD-binding component [Actinobacteria bacterium]|jgi:CPA2 family monovalent cation:H+ antiporter-2|nr:Kef-type K+ transport system, predicted NAD-binding component [Actinomycetota bacterium]
MASIVETAPLVLDVGVVLTVAATMGFLARKIGLPSVMGYLLTGLVVSPFTPGFVADNNQLALLADIGVVLLLFEVGIEIDLRRISREQKALLWGVPAQVAIGLLIGTPVFLWLGIPALGALLLALSVAMSSSVVIVNITRSPRRTTDTSTEDALLGWSVVQDVVGVTTAAVILALFGAGDKPLPIAIGGLFGFAFIAMAASKMLPKLLQLVRWEKDLFLIYSVSIGLVLAAMGTVVFGIPMALAGFVAGLAINQSRDTDEVRKAILPFRDLFAVLFFVVIGSLIEPGQISKAWPFALLLLVMMVVLKSLPTALLSKLGKMKVNRVQFAIGISQIGEFSFVLGSLAYSQEALTQSQYTGVLLAVVLSIMGSTLLVRRVPV